MNKILLSMLGAGMLASAAEAASYRGDFNHDSQLDMQDMVTLARAINSGNPDLRVYDLNADGIVDDRDLDALANIILSQTLTEENGVNVGIGNWGDGGEWGGTVGDNYRSRIPEENISFRPTAKVYFKDGRTFIDSYLEGDDPISGILFDIAIPTMVSDSMLDDGVIDINDECSSNHRIYGTVYKSTDPDNNSLHCRFILFSPKLDRLILSNKPLFSLSYLNFVPDYEYGIIFSNCQTVLPDSGEVMNIRKVDYPVNWEYTTLTDILIDSEEVVGNSGDNVIIPFSWTPTTLSY
ncbi:MAG: hypothetical protein K2F64_05555, partial [Muribaculaceae bacterium]|nr:hypothetical protein [Muribaculaceae bacterium]